MGFGSENVCKIRTDKCGKINVEDLMENIETCISADCEPLMVSATAGTTVLGAFDNLEKIADLCNKYNMWMHVDAAWGGGALMSPKYHRLLNGIERYILIKFPLISVKYINTFYFLELILLHGIPTKC